MGEGFGLIYFNTVSIQSVLRRDGGGVWAYLFQYSLNTKCTDERWGRGLGLFKRHGLTRLFMVLNYPHIL